METQRGKKMKNLSTRYLNKTQLIEKYPFLTANMLKNLLFQNIGGFRDNVAKKLGRRIIIDEDAFLTHMANLPSVNEFELNEE